MENVKSPGDKVLPPLARACYFFVKKIYFHGIITGAICRNYSKAKTIILAGKSAASVSCEGKNQKGGK